MKENYSILNRKLKDLQEQMAALEKGIMKCTDLFFEANPCLTAPG